MPGRTFMDKVPEIGSLILQKAHDLNNLITVVEGNMEMMRCDDDEIISDNIESFQECKEIIKFLYITSMKLKKLGAND